MSKFLTILIQNRSIFFTAFQFCKQFDVEFLTWRCWIGFWVMIILFGVVALEGCFLIKYFTRFTEDIFELLISAIFIYEPIALLYKVSILFLVYLVYCRCVYLWWGKSGLEKGPSGRPEQVTFKFSCPVVKGLSKSSSN